MADENGAVQQQAQEDQNQTNTDECTEFIRDPILDTEEMKKMFVGGITIDAKDEEVKEFFENVCPGNKVTDTVVIRKEGEKKSHFGFVTFETSEMVDEVLLKRSELTFKSRNLDVNRAVPKGNTQPGAHDKTKKLFIANLPKHDCNEDELRKYFEQRHPKKYGVIESVQLIKKKDDAGNKMEENKGYGFIMVSSEDMADKMAIEHQNFDFKGRRIELKKSVPTGGDGGKRGGKRGGGGGGGQQNYGGAGFHNQAGGYGGGYGGWGGQDYYNQGYDYSGYGYGGYGAGGYGGGYGAPPAARGGRGGRGGRYTPY